MHNSIDQLHPIAKKRLMVAACLSEVVSIQRVQGVEGIDILGRCKRSHEIVNRRVLNNGTVVWLQRGAWHYLMNAPHTREVVEENLRRWRA